MSFTVRVATEEDSPGIRELFGRTFGRAMTAEEWRWKYPENPDGWIATVAELDGRIVGHYGGWPLRAVIGGRESTIVSVGDVATEPSIRHLGGRRNAFRSMADALFDVLKSRGVPFVFGFPNARALAAGARLLGYRAEFPVRTIEYELEGGLTGSGIGSEWVEASYDALWDRCRAALPAGLLRDRRRINWRYHARPDRWYRFVTVEGTGGDAACGVLSVLAEEALVVEAAVADASGALRLFEALSAEAAALGARRLVFWETPDGPLSAIAGRDAARRRGARAAETGFSFATVPFDEAVTAEFVRCAQIAAGIYDDR
ncbi:MAG TPA: GNAT family N-acetyltransferase [Thermoanaerobaculia bacterium]|nr:GNAT family N-acetyltransferase [Thermoanaerobaculia bacterium]